MKKLSIKAKLILLFILIKVIPLLIIAYISVKGVLLLEEYFTKNTVSLFNTNKKIIETTASKAIDDSIQMLDKKSQISLEKFSYQIAQNVASFLYERDKDLLFLSSLPLNQKILENFYENKSSPITLHEPYKYDNTTNKWISTKELSKTINKPQLPTLEDNNKEFHYTNPVKTQTKNIPIYKEVVFFNTLGDEIYKVSQINNNKNSIANKKNTYIKAEEYFSKIQLLKKGEIYVSQVIGAYVSSNIIGTFSKAKAKKMGIKFKPEQHAYAGKENPKGKRFEGIIRFITPVFKNQQKIGFISLALDHRHIMEFTDSINPTTAHIKQNIADASEGNYAFMWDYLGKNISHPRDYFIVGFDPQTGKKVAPWVSADIQEKFEKSNSNNLISFLKNYPTFEAQSLKKKPNLKQLKNQGNIGLDCRYLNFAPQCKGWMEVTQDGGYGSFIIYWSKVWKLTTAATIPYYTGQYNSTKRGFGFVTIGANVDEFHSAAMKTKQNVNKILENQTASMEKNLQENHLNIITYIDNIVNELSVITIVMILLVILIAIWVSNFITRKIANLLIATKKFANNEFDYQIKITSDDEVGQLEKSFNDMTSKISKLIYEQQQLNTSLETKVNEAIKKTEQNERIIREKDNILAQKSKMAAMGEMLENIAHQWRQPLSVISTSSSGLKMKKKLNLLKEKDIEVALDNIMDSTNYLSNTIDDFRNFFDTNKERTEFNIKTSIEKTLNIISSKFTNLEIIIIKNLSDIKIQSYENEIIQVLMNILNNSKDEFIEKEITPRYIFIDVTKKDNLVIITTKDNAGGVPESIINRVFEPYFTTKHKSQGTGIGLHMSREIITKHMQGTISVQNVEYEFEQQTFKGAEFKIEIPLEVEYNPDFSI